MKLHFYLSPSLSPLPLVVFDLTPELAHLKVGPIYKVWRSPWNSHSCWQREKHQTPTFYNFPISIFHCVCHVCVSAWERARVFLWRVMGVWKGENNVVPRQTSKDSHFKVSKVSRLGQCIQTCRWSMIAAQRGMIWDHNHRGFFTTLSLASSKIQRSCLDSAKGGGRVDPLDIILHWPVAIIDPRRPLVRA